MPISNLAGLPAIADEIYRLQPKSVLDLGVGFGLYGAVARQVLDAMHGRCRPDQWETRIFGIEGYRAYINPCWQIYDHVVIGPFDDASTYEDRIHFDLVLMIDSLEHLDPTEGMSFLEFLVSDNKHVIVSVPVEPCPQGAVYGNEYETHRTHYNGTEFERFNPVILHRGLCQVMSIKGRA